MALVSIGSLLILPASAQHSQNWEWCSGRGGPTLDQRIDACSAIIASSGETRENLAKAYGNRGIAYNNKDEFDRAASDYEESVRLDPTSAFGHRIRGNAYKLKKDYDRAIAEYDEAISLDPNDALALGNRGAVYYAKQDYDRAIAELSEAIRHDPAFTIAFYVRGLAYLAKHDAAHAIADFDEAIRLDPKFAIAFADRGRANAEKKEYDRAIADYTEALGMEPIERAAASAISGRCWVRFIVGRDLQDTVADCTKALNLRPNVVWILNARAFTYLKLGELDRSISDFDAALAVKSNPAVAHYGDAAVLYYGRGLAKQKAGQTQAADTDMWVARSFRPDVAKVVAQYGVK
jgi:tetratricopeptide (TPR) repeat protein